MTVKKCDRCGAEIKGLRHPQVEVRDFGEMAHYKYYDLCRECYEKVKKVLEGKDENSISSK